MQSGLGGVTTFDFQYIPRLVREKSEVHSGPSIEISLLDRKLEIFCFVAFISIIIATGGLAISLFVLARPLIAW